MAQRTLHSSPSENQTTIFPSICWGRAWWYHSKSDTYLSWKISQCISHLPCSKTKTIINIEKKKNNKQTKNFLQMFQDNWKEEVDISLILIMIRSSFYTAGGGKKSEETRVQKKLYTAIQSLWCSVEISKGTQVSGHNIIDRQHNRQTCY